ncbi:hypothetical protein WMY93_001144 [Mugilogobius chulae]|uniref:LCCL domain-containing protein n=1 Tax=Mugilogobius chulae TaxID=88201 RepID=A0AAW0Q2U7_9GOBI
MSRRFCPMCTSQRNKRPEEFNREALQHQHQQFSTMTFLFEGWIGVASLFLCLSHTVSSMVLTNSSHLESILDKYWDKDEEWWRARSRGKRAITEGDMHLILDLHNNFAVKYILRLPIWSLWFGIMSWSEVLSTGRTPVAHWGRDRPPTFHVQAWYDEVRYYSYPYAQECEPHCPFRCSGPVCTHYTQWELVGPCPLQIWISLLPMPASYAGGCRDNLCYRGGGVDRRPAPELEENNYIEPEPEPDPVQERDLEPRAQSPDPPRHDNPQRNQVVSTEQMSQQVECDTKLRDQCKGTTCNRYECPPGCLDRPGKAVGSGYYDMQSSVCAVGLHAGVIDNDGGWLDVTRVGRKPHFTKSYKNGIQSIGKNRSANSFKVEKVPVKAVTCDTTVALYCPFKKPVRHCPRLYCPRNCLHQSQIRVIGTKYYSDKSSICRAGVHAGVIQNESGGYLDVMPVDRRRQYKGSHQNGITSETLLNPTTGKAFRVFAVI